MKKALSLLVIAALSAAMLVACGGKDDSSAVTTPEYKDGTYRAENATFDHGYKEFLEVTYKDGKVTDVTFDAVSEKDPAVLKSSLTIEQYPMFTGENGDEPFNPAVWYPTLENNIKEAATADDVAIVAGATHSSDNARKYLAAIQAAAKTGDTTTQVVTLTEAAE